MPAITKRIKHKCSAFLNKIDLWFAGATLAENYVREQKNKCHEKHYYYGNFFL